MSKKTLKPVVMAAGAVVIGSLALAGTAFAMSPLAQGYLLAASSADDKPKEGSCGEGQCGGDMAAAATPAAEGTPVADDKAADGSCGEGQCGADRMGAAAPAAAGTPVAEDGSDDAAADDKADAEGTCNG
jgi:uncharacterized low-complexity protein